MEEAHSSRYSIHPGSTKIYRDFREVYIWSSMKRCIVEFVVKCPYCQNCVIRFGKKGKLSPRYIGPYRIFKRIGNVGYELELPTELAAVHPVFHLSMLKKCMGDPSLIIPTENIGMKDHLSYEEKTVDILDRQVRKLRTKEVAFVKDLWRNQFVKEGTWEAEEDIKNRYPHLFSSGEIPN
ncbi:hypothetical protein MTR67_038788 [Solanum verrucosum]|uniref:Chromo domain-containing protein n=1 Tax=Solanum verrucosum TaxID=315347 RepID=A0AAF0UGM4_SOLVR|nr:hypothetical protein MTR67_038788 [Solanum verrucosum]